jgi:hypothetical protein
MDDSLYITDDERENARGSDEVREEPSEGPRKERKPWVEWMDSVFGRLEGESTDDDSDALVCEGLDEPNYISADHGYYPDISRWQSNNDDDSTVKPEDPNPNPGRHDDKWDIDDDDFLVYKAIEWSDSEESNDSSKP